MGVRIRDMAQGGGGQNGGGSPQVVRRPAAGGGESSSGDAGDELPEGMDVKRLYQDNRKLSRLLAKQQEETASLRAQFEPTRKQLDSLRTVFGGREPPREEGKPAPSVYDRVAYAHQRMLDEDPESGGMPLTLGMAEQSNSAYERTSVHEKEIAELKEQLKRASDPMTSAENAMFVALDAELGEMLLELYEDETTARDNYQDFSRLAIDKMAELKAKDIVKWRRLVTSPKVQREFLMSVVTSKLPRSYAKRGAQPIDEYPTAAAMADMNKAMTMKPSPERAQLMAKARRRLLPETLGLEIQSQR